MAEVMKMPLLSDTMTEGTVVAWHKKVGDTIEIGEVLLEIETDKAVMEQDSFHEGVLLYIGVEEGSAVPVNQVLCVIGEEGEDYKAALAADAGGAKPKAEKAAPVVIEEATPQTAAPVVTAAEEAKVKASPLAKKMAEEAGINLANIAGTGDYGRIIKRDIEAMIEAPAAPVAVVAPQTAAPVAVPAPPKAFGAEGDTYEDVALTGMRKTIARRLGESKFTAPHFYLTININMDKAKQVRQQLNAFSPVKISFNDLVVKSAAMALRQHPTINSSWLGDRIRINKVFNIGVAIAVPEGLLVPVIRHTDMKSLSQISTEVRAYAEKAKSRKITPDDMSGNTFTISNLGMFGIDQFTAIINAPDACIMAVGGISDTPVVVDGEVKVASIMKVTLSCDHRVVDGASGAKFLQTFKELLENPIGLMV